MKINKPSRINGRVPVLSAQEAVNYIPDEALYVFWAQAAVFSKRQH